MFLLCPSRMHKCSSILTDTSARASEWHSGISNLCYLCNMRRNEGKGKSKQKRSYNYHEFEPYSHTIEMLHVKMLTQPFD